MNTILNWFDLQQLASSAQWVRVGSVACMLGIAACIMAIRRHVRLSRGPGTDELQPRAYRAAWPMGFLWAALTCIFVSVMHRYYEVNHFPSQTMSEVLTMFTLGLLVSMVILHYTLGFQRDGPAWAIVDDALILCVLGGALATQLYVDTLVTAQRDLPPALQSYWFAPHLSALIFSYATMGIAALICLVYFAARYWSAAYARGKGQGNAMLGAAWLACVLLFCGIYGLLPLWAALMLPILVVAGAVIAVPRFFPNLASDPKVAANQPWTFLGLCLFPFVQVVTLPVLALTGSVFQRMQARQTLPGAAALSRVERTLDDKSFRAFAVGMPFLTAGLWMGAFWAQEAWANYWGWDSKENSALITWLVYVVYIHLRMLGGYRGAKAMSVLMAGALSVFLTFQVFGYLPDSQKSLHRYTDDGVAPREGQQGPAPAAREQAAVGEGGTAAKVARRAASGAQGDANDRAEADSNAGGGE